MLTRMILSYYEVTQLMFGKLKSPQMMVEPFFDIRLYMQLHISRLKTSASGLVSMLGGL